MKGSLRTSSDYSEVMALDFGNIKLVEIVGGHQG